ncbi:MAG: hypothetical protein A2X25_01455 [Chloroflexi bacterium GWB2_49_20]|nr:MAG: hypothetical protein A2X25_01455 [Chloroflexi bacterium GWB2_49_20]OGN78121.1 MAG: hypothetical protein A2X26_14060 [Chloroflexi bacterium GWC2_49_37]OGN85158.1 MAG: hypothetical protein A2X27_06715 [Chloroflexi bacterium GWD2_49_16]
MNLIDGRQLAYAQYGDLTGKPVFFFHGTPGSRFFHPPTQITSKFGVRLITVDRPGYGSSTFQPDRKITDWPKDIFQLADSLGLDTFAIAGHSGGGPYVLACAHALPNRVFSTVTISSTGPVEAIDPSSEISAINRFGFKFGRYFPWPIWEILIYSLFHKRSRDPWKDMDQQAKNRPQADSLLMNKPEIRNNCFHSEVEAFRPGLRGFAWDTRLLTRPWGFSLEEIRVPVKIWHGLADNQAPVSMASYLSKKISTSSARLIPGEAHLLLFKYWEEILADLLSPPK